MTVTMNSNKELVAEIRAKLKANKEQYGKQYCPCVLPNNYNDDTICMCKEFREQIDRGEPGECHCGLYVMTND